MLARIFPQTPDELADADPWTALLWAGGRLELAWAGAFAAAALITLRGARPRSSQSGT